MATTLIAAALTVLGGATAASGQVTPTVDNPTMVVNSTSDDGDASGADGVCATSNGQCTLRAAMEQANYNRGSDRIEFNIPGGGTKRIGIGRAMPVINDPTGGVTIDGYTQPGSSPNTAQYGSNAVIRVEIGKGNGGSIFRIESAENTIRGLAWEGGEFSLELRGEGADGNLIIGNFIGFTADANNGWTNGTAISLNLGPDRNRIGTPALADRNVIGKFEDQGIRINHGETSQNRIQNNVIGLDPTGTKEKGGIIAIDVQWWTWGNLIGGNGPNEGNLIGGTNNGIDLSHGSTGNLVLGNWLGTTPDGRSATGDTRLGRGIIVKDDAQGNYFGQNVLAAGDRDYTIWHKQNYTGRNTFVENRVGVSAFGDFLGGTGNGGMLLRGHDDIYYNNIIAHHGGGDPILISNTSERDNAFAPDEQTANNTIRRGTYYNNGDRRTIVFGTTCCPHPNEDTPDFTGRGPGQVNGNNTCGGCEVEVYVSGSVASDGTLTPGTGTDGLTWAGTVYANGNGEWSMASPLLTAGSRVALMSNNTNGEASDFSSIETIPQNGFGLVPNPDSPITPEAPPILPEPPIYQPEIFECTAADGVLSWSDVGAAEYYVFATVTAGGGETYLGAHSTTSLNVAAADSYRVEHWARGVGTNATCEGEGGGPIDPGTFECSATNGVLSWDDAGASEYYVFATVNGAETYLGGHSTTSLNVAGADSYRVEHWITGQATNATCDGDGGGPIDPGTFECSATNGVLSWDDAGADEYYVFATVTAGGGETYLGGHSATSLAVGPADSYRVEHWLTGQATNATCDGDGPGEPAAFSCSVADGVLSWDDAGADEYYVFATTNGVEGYLGGHSTTSLNVDEADSYRVEHWITGQATNATCDSNGGDPGAFSCSVANAVLSWDDAGADEYYVFATLTPGGDEIYLGGHSATSLSLAFAADSYRVEHWLTGQATNATCS